MPHTTICKRPSPGVLALGVLTLMVGAAPAEAQVIAKAGASPGITVGSAAPEIDFETLAGGRVKLSQLRGHPIVITFWGTWCPPCRDEFPALVSAYHAHRAQGLEIIAVNQRDQELNTNDVKVFVEEFGVEFPVAMDQRGKSRRSFRLVALPTTVFVDSSGIMRTIHSGPITPGDLAKGLETILPAK